MIKICIEYPGKHSPKYDLVEAKSDNPEDIITAISYYSWALDSEIDPDGLKVHIITKTITGSELKKMVDKTQ